MMKAAIIRKFGSTDVLKFVNDHPSPSIQPNQVLLNVHASGINPLDWRIRKGELKFLLGAKFPMILGHDVSGEVLKVGQAVTRFKEGDEVYGMLDANAVPSWTGFAKSGAYAEYAVTREDTLAFKPSVLSHEEAASLPLACLTAYQALRDKADIQKGKTLLVNGASGGVGIFALQVAKVFGAQVTGVCSARSADLVTRLGADTVVDYQQHDIATLAERFDCIYDVVGTLSFSQCKHLLTESGTFVSNLPTPWGMLSATLSPLFRYLGGRKTQAIAWVKPSGKDLSTISTMVEEGHIRTVLDKVYALEEIREAHQYSETGRVHGKIVINICS